MSFPNSFPVIGLVGGVGSGKSSIARRLAKQRNIAIIDADAIGHNVLTHPHVKQKLRRVFGEEIFDAAGNVDRSRLAQRVFGDQAENQKARHQLENIVHPEIERGISETIELLRASNSVEAVLLDAAILFETGWSHVCDYVVFVDTPLPTRRQRAAEARGWTAEELERRERSQMTLEEKRSRADFVIDNSGSLLEAVKDLEKILNQIRQ